MNVLNWLKIIDSSQLTENSHPCTLLLPIWLHEIAQGCSFSSLINYGCFNKVHLLARKLDPEKLQQDNS